MNKEDTIKTNAWFLVFTLFLCYSIFFWPKVMTDRGDVYFFFNSFILNYNLFFCIPFTLFYLFELQFSDEACKQRSLT